MASAPVMAGGAAPTAHSGGIPWVLGLALACTACAPLPDHGPGLEAEPPGKADFGAPSQVTRAAVEELEARIGALRELSPRDRSRAITGLYAGLYQRDERLKWGYMAAFASAQVGRTLAMLDEMAWLFDSFIDPFEVSAAEVHQQLADSQIAVVEHLYPLQWALAEGGEVGVRRVFEHCAERPRRCFGPTSERFPWPTESFDADPRYRLLGERLADAASLDDAWEANLALLSYEQSTVAQATFYDELPPWFRNLRRLGPLLFYGEAVLDALFGWQLAVDSPVPGFEHEKLSLLGRIWDLETRWAWLTGVVVPRFRQLEALGEAGSALGLLTRGGLGAVRDRYQGPRAGAYELSWAALREWEPQRERTLSPALDVRFRHHARGVILVLRVAPGRDGGFVARYVERPAPAPDDDLASAPAGGAFMEVAVARDGVARFEHAGATRFIELAQVGSDFRRLAQGGEAELAALNRGGFSERTVRTEVAPCLAAVARCLAQPGAARCPPSACSWLSERN
jgi:hypothetical protein